MHVLMSSKILTAELFYNQITLFLFYRLFLFCSVLFFKLKNILKILVLFCGLYDMLTFILLFTTTPTFANSVDPDQMASGSTLFVVQFVNLKEN